VRTKRTAICGRAYGGPPPAQRWHGPPRRWSLRLPLFYPPLHSLISHQSPECTQGPRQTQVTSAQVSSCAQGRQGPRDEPK
ncbi:hypothetical protein JOQ06_027858, partial [Pogonophryne albipinna]